MPQYVLHGALHELCDRGVLDGEEAAGMGLLTTMRVIEAHAVLMRLDALLPGV